MPPSSRDVAAPAAPSAPTRRAPPPPRHRSKFLPRAVRSKAHRPTSPSPRDRDNHAGVQNELQPGTVQPTVPAFSERVTDMPEITAKMVNDLRAKTGLGTMECKKALTEAGGDMDRAIDNLRKKGVKTSVGERAATEGRIVGAVAEDKQSAALVEINCNTDFTAKSAPFTELGEKAARALLKNPSGAVAADPGVASAATQVSQQTGENVRVGKSAHLKAPAGGK